MLQPVLYRKAQENKPQSVRQLDRNNLLFVVSSIVFASLRKQLKVSTGCLKNVDFWKIARTTLKLIKTEHIGYVQANSGYMLPCASEHRIFKN